MKEKFKLVNKPHKYVISIICDPSMKVETQILVGKVMWKCRTNEVLEPVIVLARKCVEGVQFIWLDYPHRAFMANSREAQEQSETFHYTWLLLLIVLVACELPEESQFPSIAPDLPEVVKYTSLCVTKDMG